jgi:cellulose synthase (UDP-forming)
MATAADRTGRLPRPERHSRTQIIRAVAVLALAATLAYLTWRALYTLNLDAWYIAVPMLLLEIHAAVSLGLFAFSLWDVDTRPTPRPLGGQPRVAVLIPTYNEGPEILIPTIAAALELDPAHETWVLDDGARDEIRSLAEELGARYLARPTHEHAKAGNLNHALRYVDADIVAVLDADHVADRRLLTATLGYFADERVALVQTPQEFYNVTSFEHGADEAYGERFHEQTLFYRLLQPGKNRWNAAFWCGTNAIVRVAALREVGGAATETITEDIHTTIRFHRRGWKTVYHNEVLARGLAADDAAQYQLQRNRWGTGAMQVLRVENPLVVPGLTLPQRLGYASTLLGWFDSWRTLGFLLLPPVVLLTGQIPIAADGLTFALAFGITYSLQQAALFALGRGAYRPVLSVVFDLVRMPANFAATLTLFIRRRPRFRVTPKGRVAADRGRIEAPLALRASLGLSVVAAIVFVLDRLEVFSIPYASEWAANGAFAWLVVNAGLTWLAIRRIRSLRYAAERRSAVRFALDVPGMVDDVAATIQDVSMGGALVASAAPIAQAEAHRITVELPDRRLSIDGSVRSSRTVGERTHLYAFEFSPGQHAARAMLATAVFGGRFPVAGVARRPWSTLLAEQMGPLVARFRRRQIATARQTA